MQKEIATRAELDALVSLWELCFGKDGDFPLRFLSVCIESGSVLIRRTQDEIAAMACYVPMTDRIGGKKGGYLYAVCTHPDHRKRGHCAALIETAKTMGDFLLLIPAREELYGFYRPMGFTHSLSVPTALAPADEKGDFMTPDLVCDGAFDPLIDEALIYADVDGYSGEESVKNQTDYRKIYEICYMKRSICVIMKKSGLFWGSLCRDAVCGPLPL